MSRIILPPALPDGLAFVDAAYVKRRLEEAGATLLSLPATGTRPSQYKVAWPEMVQAVWDAYEAEHDGDEMIAVPSAAAITAMDEAFGWVALAGVEAVQTRRLLWLRLLVRPTSGKYIWSWRKLEAVFGLNRETLVLRHGRGIGRIVTRLNNPGFAERAVGGLP